MIKKTTGAITLLLLSSAAWAQVDITNTSSNRQVLEIGNANTGEVVIDNGDGQQVIVDSTAPDVPVELDTNIRSSDVNANVDKAGNTELQAGDVSAEVSRSGNVELNTGDVSASTTSAGATELKAGDVDASVGSDGSVGLNVGGINLNIR